MRTRTGAEPVEHRGNEEARLDGIHSFSGRSGSDGSIATPEDLGAGVGRTNRGDERRVNEAPWFAPVEDEGISDCPGGVCPVPWATSKVDMVNHPQHYTAGAGIECIEAIEAQLTSEEYRGYVKGNIAKYLWREKHKGGTESLKKARWYLDRLIAFDEDQNG